MTSPTQTVLELKKTVQFRERQKLVKIFVKFRQNDPVNTYSNPSANVIVIFFEISH